MNSIRKAQQELNNIKNDVIGLYKKSDCFELVVDFDKDTSTIDTINITEFGSLHQNYNIPFKRIGQFFLFPNGKNMNEMLVNPFEWSDFIKSFS